MKTTLILASQSPARRLLLEKLQLPFETIAADIDETPLSGETAKQLVARLSLGKAEKIFAQNPESIVIGADTAISINNGQTIFGKPHTEDKAVEMLLTLSGNTVHCDTGMTVISPQGSTTLVDTCRAQFKVLDEAQIRRYLAKDNPLQCAGSIKVESFGFTLLESLESEDPYGIIGLPIIKLTRVLEDLGIPVI